MDIKQGKGNITLEDIENIQTRFNVTQDSTRHILDRLFNSPTNVDYRARYMMGQLISTYFMEQYLEDPEDAIIRIKQYFNEIKNDNFDCALERIGITCDIQTLDSIIVLNNSKIKQLQKTAEKTDPIVR